MEIKNVIAELSATQEGSFETLASFNEQEIRMCCISGESRTWEMHPDTDELFYVIEGEFRMQLLEASGPRAYTAPIGSLFVVPRGVWHKPAASSRVKFIYYTPGQSLHSEAEDPRDQGLGGI